MTLTGDDTETTESTAEKRHVTRNSSPRSPLYELARTPEMPRGALGPQSAVSQGAGTQTNHFPSHQHLPLGYWPLEQRAATPALGYKTRATFKYSDDSRERRMEVRERK